ncbi:MAG: hypothetical protein HY905_13680 [Deltaproteobacteria bacterium]|nr:hypothetical protein [Deltaproteobacteria bacterium]
MPDEPTAPDSPRPRRRKREYECCCCRRQIAFCWSCKCGFGICQDCMDENAWGMTCNFVTWTCPDCGASNSYANQ